MPEISINTAGRILTLQCAQDEHKKTSEAANILNDELARWSASHARASRSELLVMAALSLASRLNDHVNESRDKTDQAILKTEDINEIIARIDVLKDQIAMLADEVVALDQQTTDTPIPPSASP
ncbi:MAG: cell division protein ZapA [Rhodobacteraceae bacterium]|nr:cell division protein ZapA [Paracoccaceae bacterium]